MSFWVNDQEPRGSRRPVPLRIGCGGDSEARCSRPCAGPPSRIGLDMMELQERALGASPAIRGDEAALALVSRPGGPLHLPRGDAANAGGPALSVPGRIERGGRSLWREPRASPSRPSRGGESRARSKITPASPLGISRRRSSWRRAQLVVRLLAHRELNAVALRRRGSGRSDERRSRWYGRRRASRRGQVRSGSGRRRGDGMRQGAVDGMGSLRTDVGTSGRGASSAPGLRSAGRASTRGPGVGRPDASRE